MSSDRPCWAAIHQPQYVPWPPYFAKIMQSDCFVFLDNVQFQKNGRQNRCEIDGPALPQWLTVPVKASLSLDIRDTPIADDKWPRKHIGTLTQIYSRCPYYKTVMPLLEEVILTGHETISDLGIHSVRSVLDYLRLDKRTIAASQLSTAGSQSKVDRIVSICKEVGASRYLSGKGAAAYQTPSLFDEPGIKLFYQGPVHVAYPQERRPGVFAGGLSIIDMIMNVSREETVRLLEGSIVAPVPGELVHVTP